MLLPGIRLVDRPGVLHFFDGRQVVSLRGDTAARSAIRAVATGADPAPETAEGVDTADLADARRLVDRLALVGDAGSDRPVSPWLPTRQWSDLLIRFGLHGEWPGWQLLSLLGYGVLFGGLAVLGYRRDEQRQYG